VVPSLGERRCVCGSRLSAAGATSPCCLIHLSSVRPRPRGPFAAMRLARIAATAFSSVSSSLVAHRLLYLFSGCPSLLHRRRGHPCRRIRRTNNGTGPSFTSARRVPAPLPHAASTAGRCGSCCGSPPHSFRAPRGCHSPVCWGTAFHPLPTRPAVGRLHSRPNYSYPCRRGGGGRSRDVLPAHTAALAADASLHACLTTDAAPRRCYTAACPRQRRPTSNVGDSFLALRNGATYRRTQTRRPAGRKRYPHHHPPRRPSTVATAGRAGCRGCGRGGRVVSGA